MDITINPNLKCKVCGENCFELREGYYYCQECGTKQDQVRDIEIENDDEFNDPTLKHAKKQKVITLKTENVELTSWECYNYIIRGLVEELLSFGAKEELKLMTLQVWAAYLRKMEVAFFNKKIAEIPKLGVRFLQRDARTLYNHVKAVKLKRRRKDDASMTSADTSRHDGREWRKAKRKLDESIYSQSAVSNDLTISQSSMNTSITCGTTRAIQLKFSSSARKQFKKTIPSKHLEKHALDGDGKLNCHTMKPKVRTLNRFEHAFTTMSMKHVYAILAIALNLIDDEMQLTDLVRFIAEGHITTKNVLQYFPENVAANGRTLLHEIQFNLYDNKFTDKALREHCGLLAKYLHINDFKKPNIQQLALRYVTDLNLPSEVATFVERMINLLPPQMQQRAPHTYPAFEARAMAYVVFVMKLFFGLDGHKEQLISKSAKKVNKNIELLSKEKKINQPKLFVWSEWVQYIEMRKVIVSQYNSSFSQQFKQHQSISQLLEELDEGRRRRNEDNIHMSEDAKDLKLNILKVQELLANFQAKDTNCESATDRVEAIVFPPTYTPAHSYYKRILLHCSSSENSLLCIPEYMRVNHMQHTLHPYMHAKALKEFFRVHGVQLKVQTTACTSNREFLGIFRLPKYLDSLATRQLRAKAADFDITEEKWLETIVKDGEPTVEQLNFKPFLESYHKTYVQFLKRQAAKRKEREDEGIPEWLISSQKQLEQRNISQTIDTEDIPTNLFLMPSSQFRTEIMERKKNKRDFDVLSMHSIDVFSEFDMEPIQNIDLHAPRRDLGIVKLFSDLSDDEEEEDTVKLTTNATTSQTMKQETDSNSSSADSDADMTNSITLNISKMDYWVLMGNIHAINDVQKKNIENKFPRSFFWLLETCAQTIGVEWRILYEQLLVIELMFLYGIDNLDKLQDCIHFKYNNPIKDFNMLVNLYRAVW